MAFEYFKIHTYVNLSKNSISKFFNNNNKNQDEKNQIITNIALDHQYIPEMLKGVKN